MEDSFIINGGKPLKGEVKLAGAKNAALKLIIAALLFDQEVVLEHIPRINDVFELCHLINKLGGKASFTEHNTVTIDGRNVNINKVDLLHGSKIRVSFMMWAPLLYKFGEAYIPNPGGCRLGARSIDRIVDGMKQLGIVVEYDSSTGYYKAVMKQKPQGEFTFSKPTHTGTEFLLMLSLFSSDTVTLHNTAFEPEVDDLIRFLNEGGAKITRHGRDITIHGVSSVTRTQPFHVTSDRIEAATFASLAVATKGEVIIGDIEEHAIKSFVDKLVEAGVTVEKLSGRKWRFAYTQELKAVNVETEPHPGFMTDWQPLFAVLMTQAHGVSRIHERVLENRFSYVPELNKLGAHIEFVDAPLENPNEFYHFNYDHTKKYNMVIEVTGPQKLHNGVLTIADIRAGATLAIAALVASGESVVNGVSMLERGYEDFVTKVQQLGGGD